MILINKWALKFKLRCPSKSFIRSSLMAFTKKLNIWLWSLIIWVRVAMKRAVIGDWDKFIDNQRGKHNQNLSVDCLLILLRLSKCLSWYHLSLTLSNVILFTQGGVKMTFSFSKNPVIHLWITQMLKWFQSQILLGNIISEMLLFRFQIVGKFQSQSLLELTSLRQSYHIIKCH